MSLDYFLDGYNVLHTSSFGDDLTRDAKREKFLRTLDAYPPIGSERNKLTVVLDGYAVKLEKIHWSNIRVVFSGDRDADTVIKERVAEHSRPRDVIVVTNDRGIRAAVRQSGAQVMSCEEFFKLGQKKTAPVTPVKGAPDNASQINDELRKLWKLD